MRSVDCDKEEIKDDNKTKSLFKRSCHEFRSDLPDWKEQHDTGSYKAIQEALDARELIKISVLKNCADDPRALAEVIAERTRSQVVQVIGKKIVLYKEGKDKHKKIELPK